ncbi:S41 family peptidase [bacterium]|nr:S41 family peptidase [bacterium]
MFQFKRLLLPFAISIQSLFTLSPVEMKEDFEDFFKAYKEQYAFFDLKKKDFGVEWDAVYAKSKTKLAKAKTDLDFYQILTEAQVSLGDGHCYNNASDLVYYGEGVWFLNIQFTLGEGNRVFVDWIHQDSEFAGVIQKGFRLVGIDGESIRAIAKRHRKWNSASSRGQFMNAFAKGLRYKSIYEGKPKSSKATLLFESLSGERIEIKSKWKLAKGTKTPASASSNFVEDIELHKAEIGDVTGSLPLELKIFKDQNIGYMKLTSFMKTDDPKPQFEKALKLLEGTDGLILDLRGNGGGVAKWGYLLANYFIDNDTPAINDGWLEKIYSRAYFQQYVLKGAFTQKDLDETFASVPEATKMLNSFGLTVSEEEVEKEFVNGELVSFEGSQIMNDRVNEHVAYDEPLVILMDGGCFSTTDIFMTAINDYKRAIFVGTPNGAGSGSPIPYVLDNSGYTAYISFGRFYTQSETMIEGRPITPDVLVSQTALDIASGRDTVLQAGFQALMDSINPSNSFSSDEVGEGDILSSTIVKTEVKFGRPMLPDYIRNAHVEKLKFQFNK